MWFIAQELAVVFHGSLVFLSVLLKVSEKLCNYYDMCKKGDHLKVAEEIKSIQLPKMKIKCEDISIGDGMEIQENGVGSL